MDVASLSEKKHSISSHMREGIEIKGVSDVISFDEAGAALETVCGNIAIEGEGLHVTVLNINDGVIEIEGRINGVYYYDGKPATKKSFLGKH